jgi:hypothetical protein
VAEGIDLFAEIVRHGLIVGGDQSLVMFYGLLRQLVFTALLGK